MPEAGEIVIAGAEDGEPLAAPLAKIRAIPVDAPKDNDIRKFPVYADSDNNFTHKLYTRGVGLLLEGGIQDTPTNPEGIENISEDHEKPKSRHPPYILSIEQQLEDIESRCTTKKCNTGSDNEGDSEGDMEIEEDSITEVKKELVVSAVKSVKSLDCPLCKERFQHPRMLPCLHTFCSSCIQKRMENNRVTCAICLRSVELTLPTVDMLPLNPILDTYVKLVEAGEGTENTEKQCSTCEEMAILWCIECQTDFCEKCKKVHLNIKAVSNHKLLTKEEVLKNVDVLRTKSEYCQQHANNELNLYCENCDILICRDCTLIDHKIHTYGFLNDCVIAKRNKFQGEVQRAQAKLVPLKQLLEAVEGDIKVTEDDKEAKKQIRNMAGSIIAKIKQQEGILLDQVSQLSKDRSSNLRKHYKELKYAVSSSESTLTFLSALFRLGEMRDLVSMDSLVRTRINEITAYRPEVEFGRKVTSFHPHLTSFSQVPKIGSITLAYNYDKIGTHPHAVGMAGAGPGGFKFPNGISFCPNGNIAVVDRSNTVQIFDKNGSFLNEYCKQEYCADQSEKLKNPNGIAIDQRGYYYVADSAKHRIAVLAPDGKYSHEIGTRSGGSVAGTMPSPIMSSGHSQLSESPTSEYSRVPYKDPRDREYREHRDYYRDSRDYRDRERDYYDRRRERSRDHDYSRDYKHSRYEGEYERRSYDRDHSRKWEDSKDAVHQQAKKMKMYPSTDAFLNGPRGVEVSLEGLIVVADTTNHCIKVFMSDGRFVRTIGAEGDKPGQMRTPSGVSLDKCDNIYVSDTELHRITVFKFTGEFVRMFGRKGTAEGEFLFPSDVAVDRSNSIFVSDCDNNRIQVFDEEGNFMKIYTLAAAGITLKKPLGIAVDGNGNVGICDTGNHGVWLL